MRRILLIVGLCGVLAACGGTRATTDHGGAGTPTTAAPEHVPTKDELQRALLGPDDLTAYTVVASTGSAGSGAAASGRPECDAFSSFSGVPGTAVGVELQLKGTTVATENLEAAPAAQLSSKLAELKTRVAACNGATYRGPDFSYTLRGAQPVSLGDDSLAIDVDYDVKGGTVAAHLMMIKQGSVGITVMGIEGGSSPFNRAATEQLALRAIDKVQRTSLS